MTVSHSRWNTDPLVIRQALAWRESHKHHATAARFGVSESTLRNWRNKRAQAVEEGGTWPADTDVVAYDRRTARREHDRLVRHRWHLRQATDGLLRISPIGTQRRIHALVALGWRYQDIADRLGVTLARVGHLASGQYGTVHRDLADAVARIYDDLGGSLGPSERSRRWALSRGWAPPQAWDDDTIDDPHARPNRGTSLHHGDLAFDEVAVERAMYGDAVHLRPVERAEATRRLTGLGYSAVQIAERLHTTTRSVQRQRGRRSA